MQIRFKRVAAGHCGFLGATPIRGAGVQRFSILNKNRAQFCEDAREAILQIVLHVQSRSSEKI